MTIKTRLPIFIFDLDATVADDRWRHHLLPKTVEGWKMIEAPALIDDPVAVDNSFNAYHDEMHGDEPLHPGATILRAAIAKGYVVEFSTARPERFRSMAVRWIRKHFGDFSFVVNMRADGYCASSVTIKAEHIKTILKRHGNGTAFMYDDRTDVCQMAHKKGLISYVVHHDRIVAFDGRAVDAADELDEDMKEAHRNACQPSNILVGQPFVDSPRATGPVVAREVTETVGEVSVKTRTEYLAPTITLPDGSVRTNVGSDNLSDEDRRKMDRDLTEWLATEEGKAASQKTAADVLQAMADTFRERNKVYGNNAEMVGRVMQVLFPKGVRLTTPEDYHMWHLFELKIVKLTRFAISGLTHQDSVHDDAVYSAMCELLVGSHSINFKGE